MLCCPGLSLGGLWGLREGAKKPLAVSNTRLRINAILNSVTRRGTFVGNSAGVLGEPPNWDVPLFFLFLLDGVLALVYNGINSTIDHLRGRHDALGSMAAGGLTGALYKSTGVYSDIPTLPGNSLFVICLSSWRKTCVGGCDVHVWTSGCLELYQTERLEYHHILSLFISNPHS